MIAAETYFDIVGFMDLAECHNLITLSATMNTIFNHQIILVAEKRWLWLQYNLEKMDSSCKMNFEIFGQTVNKVRQSGSVEQIKQVDIQWKFLVEECRACLNILDCFDGRLKSEIRRRSTLLEEKFPGFTQNFDWAYGWNLSEMPFDTKYELLQKIVGQLYSHGLTDDADLAESRLINYKTSIMLVKSTLNCMLSSVKTEHKHIDSLGIGSDYSGYQRQNDGDTGLSQVSTRIPTASDVPSPTATMQFERESCQKIIDINLQKLEVELKRTKLLIEAKDAEANTDLGFKFGWHVEELTSDKKFEMLMDTVSLLFKNGLNYDSALAKRRLSNSETTISCVKAVLVAIKACLKTEKRIASVTTVPVASDSSGFQLNDQMN
uniref:Uncharacterized protein n=1 Tax=Ditylenchus dipsaci TaxID=166011 RepID=A0A915CRU0_9BILA